MKTLLTLSLTLLLSACATISGPMTSDQSKVIDGLCASSSAAVKLLAVARSEGKLSADTIARVDFARTVVEPVCGQVPRPTLDDLRMQAFTHAIAALAAEAAKEH